MKVGISVGHMGKSSEPFDKGAARMLEGIEHHESDIAFFYSCCLMNLLYDERIPAFFITSGDYPDRLKQAERLGVSLLLHCHVNSHDTGANHVVVAHSDKASERTKRIGKSILDSIGKGINVEAKETRTLVRGDRGYSMIEPVGCSSLLIEPYFISSDYYKRMSYFHEIGKTSKMISYAIFLSILHEKREHNG